MQQVRLCLAAVCTLLCCGAALAVLPCQPECQHGECIADHGNLSCRCDENWFGEDCSTFICDVESPCLNGARCIPDTSDPTGTSYACANCNIGFSGLNCELDVDSRNHSEVCTQERCRHGTCYINATGGSYCDCDPGFYGLFCGETINYCANNTCNGRGECFFISDTLTQCRCNDTALNSDLFCEFYNTYDICGLEDPCPLPRATECITTVRNGSIPDYICNCAPEYAGRNCTEEFDVCDGRCMNGGTCSPTADGHYFTCDCADNFDGHTCALIVDPCLNIECLNGGTCVPESNPNEDGFYTDSNTQCECPAEFFGDDCESRLPPCDFATCQNGGTCINSGFNDGSHTCNCPGGFTGAACETTDFCHLNPCHNSSECISTPLQYYCSCTEGRGGPTCHQFLDACSPNPCNEGTCQNEMGGYTCECPPQYTGQDCDSYNATVCPEDHCLNGGECHETPEGINCTCLPGFTGLQCQTQLCVLDHCATVRGDGICNPECLLQPECGNDGGDCAPSRPSDDNNPWADCPLEELCRSAFANGSCEVACNTPVCLYDGSDCTPAPLEECPQQKREECAGLVGDGQCTEDCNTELCQYDSEDCANREQLIPGQLVLYLLIPTSLNFTGPLQEVFLQELGRLTSSVPLVESVSVVSEEELAAGGTAINILAPSDEDYLIYKVVLKLDTQFCMSQCLRNAEEAARLLQAYCSSGQCRIGSYALARASAEPDDDVVTPGQPTWTYSFILIALVVVVMVVVIVLVFLGKRKRTVIAKLWRPTSPSEHTSPLTTSSSSPSTAAGDGSRKSGQAGEAVEGTEASSIVHSISDETLSKGSKKAKMEPANGAAANVRWNAKIRVHTSDDPAPNHSPSSSTSSETAVLGQSGRDDRHWNTFHYEALKDPQHIKLLMDRYRKQNGKSRNVNAPGPGGFTPLMLAVIRRYNSRDSLYLPSRSSSESSAETNEHSYLIPHGPPGSNMSLLGDSSQVFRHNGAYGHYLTPPMESSVSALLDLGVNVDAVNDFNQTALHLAAACARGDYVEQLLEAGANPNQQDNWGQTPLQAAIGAAAEGAFMLLINQPKCDLNLKSDGGITPLMAAVKIANQFMVNQLIKKNVDISITDSDNRTAVHWAAMVNNFDALKELIKRGPDTIKDAQDSKGQTALFLACREGSVPCVRHLLDCFANATLLDNLDRSPIQIAYERQHLDVVEMLKSSVHGPIFYPAPHHPNAGGRAQQNIQPNAMVHPLSQIPEQQHQDVSSYNHRQLIHPMKTRKSRPYDHCQYGGPVRGAGEGGDFSGHPAYLHASGPAAVHTFGNVHHHPITTANSIPMRELHTQSAAPPHSHSHSSTPLSQYQQQSPPLSHDIASTHPITTGYLTSNTSQYIPNVHPPATSAYAVQSQASSSTSAGNSLSLNSAAGSASAGDLPVSSNGDLDPSVEALMTSVSGDLVVDTSVHSSVASSSYQNSAAIGGYSLAPASSTSAPPNPPHQAYPDPYTSTSTSSYYQYQQNNSGRGGGGGGAGGSDLSSLATSMSTSAYHPEPTSATTQPLQHLPINTDYHPPQYNHAAAAAAAVAATSYSPPHSGGGLVNSSSSPPTSSIYPSPPNSNEVSCPSASKIAASPPSLTPSPESRAEEPTMRNFDQFRMEYNVEQHADYSMHLPLHQPYIMHSALESSV